MKRTIIIAALGLLAAWCTAQMLRPWLFLPADKIVALVSERCGISQELVVSVMAAEEVRRAVVVVPVDSMDTPRRAETCSLSISLLRDRAPWFSLFSDQWICEQLVRDAARYHHSAFTGVPGYMIGGVPVTSTRVDAALSEQGLVRRRGVILREALVEEMIETKPHVEKLLGEPRAVYGQDIGF
jgi:hypothetical protein